MSKPEYRVKFLLACLAKECALLLEAAQAASDNGVSATNSRDLMRAISFVVATAELLSNEVDLGMVEASWSELKKLELAESLKPPRSGLVSRLRARLKTTCYAHILKGPTHEI